MSDDFIIQDIPTVDRSTLQRYVTCPAQARLIDLGFGRHAGLAAVSGEEVHKAISATVSNYIESHGAMSPQDIREDLERNLRSSRPDVQPDVIAGFNAFSLFVKMLKDLHPQNILRYDGGEGQRSGQLAADIEHLGVRVTAEVDFLHATASPEVLDLHDWKTGQKRYTLDDVADAFQFQVYAWLVFNTYEGVEQVRVTAWNTRFNERTPRIVFKRADLPAINARVIAAAGEWLRNKDRDADKLIAYPSPEACRLCDVAYRCPEADAEPRQISESVEAYVDQLAAVEAKADAMRKTLSAWVDKTGRDIVTPAGNAFGTQKPKAKRKPEKTLYAVVVTDDE